MFEAELTLFGKRLRTTSFHEFTVVVATRFHSSFNFKVADY